MPKDISSIKNDEEKKVWFANQMMAWLKARKDFILHQNNQKIVKIFIHQVNGEQFAWALWELSPEQISEFLSIALKNEWTYTLKQSEYGEELEKLEYGEIESGGYEYFTPVVYDVRGGDFLEELSLTPFVKKLKETSPYIEVIIGESSEEGHDRGLFSVERSKSLQLTWPNLQILAEEFGCKISLEEKKLTVYFDNLDKIYQETIAFKTAIKIMSMM